VSRYQISTLVARNRPRKSWGSRYNLMVCFRGVTLHHLRGVSRFLHGEFDA
jgi:hypothetical protein